MLDAATFLGYLLVTMQAAELLRMRDRQPFVPFVLHLADGRRFEIQSPRVMMVFPHRVMLSFFSPGPGTAAALEDTFEIVPLDAIVALEPLQDLVAR